MDFEWDINKAKENLNKHHIDFQDATKVFLDPYQIIDEDRRKKYGESRFKIIGMVYDMILVVVYTYRRDAIRIISARKAESYERRKYHEI